MPRSGAGRKRAEQVGPGPPATPDALVKPVTRGDPESPLRWTARSLNTLATELTRHGHPVSDDTMRRLLIEAGYSLQGNAEVPEGYLTTDISSPSPQTLSPHSTSRRQLGADRQPAFLMTAHREDSWP
ncbi:hypothetical protein ACIBI9_67385 [Nonomuraea sp. NPDC050451]|uniref:ISAzo13-like element transposase-related protein n=1 Tax=Nonomuraea sp. NPDC050451 TaxID=3364364 RepID=UPI0037AF88AB